MTKKSSRRKFVKTATYVAPLILTLKVTPAEAGTGSAGSDPRNRGRGHGRGRGRNERCGKPGRGWF